MNSQSRGDNGPRRPPVPKKEHYVPIEDSVLNHILGGS